MATSSDTVLSVPPPGAPAGDALPRAPLGSPLTLDETLDACRDGATLLTVNRRLARDLLARFERSRFEAGAPWWEAPAILPLSRWLETLHDEALTLGLSERTRLAPLLAERRWHALVERDRALALLAPRATARQALRAWQLGHAWECLPAEDDYLPLDQYHWRRWAAGYAASLDDGRLLDEATLAAHLVGVVEAGGLPLPARVVLGGFLSPTPAARRLLAALAVAGVEVAELADGALGRSRSVLWPDDAAELAGIADAVRRRLDREPEAVLGVVIPDLDARRAEVLRAFDRRFFPAMTPAEIERAGRPYDLSLGRPLADAPAVRAALLALRLALGGPGGLEQRDLSALLLSPYVGEHAAECRGRERLDRRLREERVQRLDLAGFAARLDRASALRRPLARLARAPWAGPGGTGPGGTGSGARRARLADWAERVERCLDAFGWPGGELDSEEFQAVQAWHGVLGDLARLDEGGRVGAGEALALLRHLAVERLFQPETADLPVRVLGRLESHGQRFDALWVAGLDTERWPPAGAPSPFLPIARQKAAGMPEASGAARLALARAEFAHWRAAAPELVASRAVERDGKPLDSASVLGGVGDADDAVTLEVGTLDVPLPAALVAAAATLETVRDETGPPLDADAPAVGGARLFEDQAACPFRAFAAHRLRVRPLEEVAGGIDSRQAGTLLHRALELFWRRVRTHAALLALAAAGALHAEVERAVGAALDAERVDPAWRELERRRLEPLLGHWLEAHEAPRAPFEVVAFECTRETCRGGVRVTLTIDRVDRLVGPGAPLQGATDDEAGEAALDGERLVLDYKSGTRNGVDGWIAERIREPQLPLYALTDARVAGVAYAQVATHGCRFKGAVADEGLLPHVAPGDGGWDARRALWRDALDVVGEEIRTGRAEIRPAAGACTRCTLRALCRVDP